MSLFSKLKAKIKKLFSKLSPFHKKRLVIGLPIPGSLKVKQSIKQCLACQNAWIAAPAELCANCKFFH